MSQKLTFIYGLIDPRNNQLRYIGKSDNPQARLAKHIREAKRSTELHRLAWIRGLLNEGLSPKLLSLMQVPKEGWQIVERLLIASLNDNVLYDLTNMADGGLGGSTARGKKRSKQARDNIRQGLIELYSNNDELRENQRKKTTEFWTDKELKEKRIAAMNTKKAKENRSKAQNKRWKDQDQRKKQSEVGKRNWQSPELAELMRDKVRAKWQDPEYREKQRKSRLKAWEKRRSDKANV